MADETFEIGVEVKGANKLNELAGYMEQVGEAEEAVLSKSDFLSGSFEEMTGLAQPLSGRLGELEDRMYELAAAGQANTKEFNALEKEAVRMRKTIIQVDAAIDSAAEGGKNLNTALQLSSSVVAGYQGFASVTALVGDNQEELMETMVKLQAAEGALQSIQQIRYTLTQNQVVITKAQTVAQNLYNKVVGKSVGGLKAFRVALAATGIGLAVVAVGALVENWDALTNALMGTSDAQNAMNDAMVEGMKAASSELLALEDLSREIDHNKGSREDIVQAVKDFQSEHPELLKGLDAEEATMSELNKAIAEQTRLTKLLAIEKALQAKREEIYSEIIEEQLLLTTQQNAGMMDYIGSALVPGANAQASANAQSKVAIQNNQELLKQLNLMSDALKGQIGLLEETPDKYADEKRAMYERRVEAEKVVSTNKALKHTYEDLAYLAEEYKQNQTYEILRGEQQDDQIEMDIASDNMPQFMLDEIEWERTKLQKIMGLQIDHAGRVREFTEEEQMMRKTAAQTMVSQYSQAFSTIAGVFEEGSAAQKGFALASIIADTAEALMGAVPLAIQAASAGGPAAPFIFGGTLASIVGTVVAAAANAKQVLSSAPGGAPSGGGGGGISVPTSNLTPRGQESGVSLNLFGEANDGSEGGIDDLLGSDSENSNQNPTFVVNVSQTEIQAVDKSNADLLAQSQM